MAANTLISAAELAALPEAVIIDCRHELLNPTAGREAFAAGHIPNARFVDMDKQLSGPHIAGSTGRHPLPDKEAFVATLGSLGIHNHSTVIAYDANNGAFAARFWWLLRWVGHDNVRVLDGGFKAWQAAGLAISQSAPVVTSASFNTEQTLTKTVSADDLLNHREQTLTDARDLPRFKGEVEPIDPVAGHIPGAICLPFADNLDEHGRFQSPEVLKARFHAAGLNQAASTICYCGSGVTACHNILALVHAGFPEPALYPGSWSEWITDPDRPVATAETAG